MIPIKWLTGIPMPYYFLSLALLLQVLPGLIISVSRAQGTPIQEGLAIGQPVPGKMELEMVNYHAPTAKLSDFKGKLLILDFYATWCSDSRQRLPLLDSLQQEYGEQLKILLVSYHGAQDSAATVKTFYERWRKPDGSRYGLPSVVNDTTLIRYFPHQLIPHFAWIGPDGTLQAITRAEQVTAPNIRRAIKEGIMPVSLLPNADLSQPLPVAGRHKGNNLLHYAVLLQGKIDDGPGRSQLRKDGESVNGIVVANMPLVDMYDLIKQNLYPELGSKGLVLAGLDSAALYPEKSHLSPADWKAAHIYSYDLVVPKGKAASMYRIMLEDLNRYSGYTATLELQEQDCLLLVRKGRKDKLKSTGGEPLNMLYRRHAPSMQHMPLTTLVARLNTNNTLPLLVVNQTGYTGTADIELKSGFSSLPVLRTELQAYGLDLVPARRKVPVLVLRRQQQTDGSSLSFKNL